MEATQPLDKKLLQRYSSFRSLFGLSNGTLAPVIAVIHPPAGTAHPASFCPLLMVSIMQIVIASGLPGTGKGKNLESSHNNSGLDEWEKGQGRANR